MHRLILTVYSFSQPNVNVDTRDLSRCVPRLVRAADSVEDSIGCAWEANPLEELRKTGLWIDEETYIDYELLECEDPRGDAMSIKPNSTSDTEGIIKSLKHLYRARERDAEVQRLRIQSTESEKTSLDLETSSVNHR
jgi:hypothetical protein